MRVKRLLYSTPVFCHNLGIYFLVYHVIFSSTITSPVSFLRANIPKKKTTRKKSGEEKTSKKKRKMLFQKTVIWNDVSKSAGKDVFKLLRDKLLKVIALPNKILLFLIILRVDVSYYFALRIRRYAG